MALLKKEHKIFIVKQLACFSSPSDVADKLKSEYNLIVSSSQIVYYNPDNIQGTKLSKALRHLFYETRRKYVEDESSVPIFHKGYRFQQMQENYDIAKKRGNIVLAQQILVDAAKEAGGMYEKNSDLLSSRPGNFFDEINRTIRESSIHASKN